MAVEMFLIAPTTSDLIFETLLELKLFVTELSSLQ